MIIPEAYHPMHPMGHSAFVFVDHPVNDINGLIYIHIPKNASSWARHHLGQHHSEPYNYYHQGFDVKKNLALVILRDPIERWISAMAQELVGASPGHHMHIDKINWDEITKTIYRDNHTQPQHEFFANIPHNSIVWFRCDNSLIDRFSSFLNQHNLPIDILTENDDVDNIFNVTKKIPEKIVNNYQTPTQQKIVDQIRTVLDQYPEYVERLKNLYQEDYKLLDSVPYYDPR